MTNEENIETRSKGSGNDKYYPVKLLISFNLKKLPNTHKGFIDQLNKKMPVDGQFEVR